MKTLIVGGNGFVGSHLTPFLVEKGFEVTVMARRPDRGAKLPSEVKMLTADATKPGEWQAQVPTFDLLINLAGVSVFKRWDEAYKKLLRDTRILTTRHLVEAIPSDDERKITLLNTSGAGIYGPTGDEEISESASHVAFYPSKMDACYVDDEMVFSQSGDFYGGWITKDIVGPFKGEPGTGFWWELHNSPTLGRAVALENFPCKCPIDRFLDGESFKTGGASGQHRMIVIYSA